MNAAEQSPVTAEMSQVAYLLELADDVLILGHRLSEWCGHGPMLEEDIALANIGLDCLGHAQFLLQHAAALENQGRDADALAFFRDSRDFRNVILVEQPNGDFAQTILRQFFFDSYYVAVLSALEQSSMEFLAGFAAKAKKEASYHLRHASQWVLRLGDGTAESRRRMQTALDTLTRFTLELFTPSAACLVLRTSGVSADPSLLKEAWETSVTGVFENSGLTLPASVFPCALSGRNGCHSEHLGRLLAEMQSTARAFPDAHW